MTTKYIITDKGEVVIGENTYHHELAKHVKGKIVGAGHVAFVGNNKPHVFGQSFGYNMKAKPEDAEVIRNAKNIIRV